MVKALWHGHLIWIGGPFLVIGDRGPGGDGHAVHGNRLDLFRSLALRGPVEVVNAVAMSFTAEIAKRSVALRYEDLPTDIVEWAKQCILDYVGVTLAGSRERTATLVLDEIVDVSGPLAAPAGVTVFGHQIRLSMHDAALVNGTASHALDYDDVNRALFGHPTVPVLPALLALAEHLGSSGAAVIEAFVAGYEAENRIGTSVSPTHYDRGYHATGSVGVFGAAVACARLMELDLAAMRVAIGLAAAQAAGLKSMFGTMTKPLHAGKAAANGVLAARLAARGFTANDSAIETEQGFAEVLGGSFDPARALVEPDNGWHLRNNLFKYHAACYETHSTIEGLRRLREAERLSAESVARVVIHVDPARRRMCAIAEPVTGLECKFSLSHTAAMALAGRDTSSIDAYTDDGAFDPELLELRSRIEMVDGGHAGRATPVDITLRDGRVHRVEHDVNVPETDLDKQRAALTTKCRSLTGPVVGERNVDALVSTVLSLERIESISVLARLVGRPQPASSG